MSDGVEGVLGEEVGEVRVMFPSVLSQAEVTADCVFIVNPSAFPLHVVTTIGLASSLPG